MTACRSSAPPTTSTLAYTDEGEGRPVVLVHGFTAPASSWALTVDALLDAGYRAITFDRRAHGESESPAHGQRMARHGRDLGELLAHLDLEDAVVVGASMGGNSIWAYVDQFGPARLRGAVIVDQTPKMLNADGWPYGFYGYTRRQRRDHVRRRGSRTPAAAGRRTQRPRRSRRLVGPPRWAAGDSATRRPGDHPAA